MIEKAPIITAARHSGLLQRDADDKYYREAFVKWLKAKKKYYQSSDWGVEYLITKEELETILSPVEMKHDTAK